MAFRKVELLGSKQAQDVSHLEVNNLEINENILNIIEDIVIKTLNKYGYKRLENIPKEQINPGKPIKNKAINSKDKQLKAKPVKKKIANLKPVKQVKSNWVHITK